MVGTPTEFEMILAGGQGTMSADDWWQISFEVKSLLLAVTYLLA